MRRLSSRVGTVALTLIVGVILAPFLIASFNHGKELNADNFAQTGCNSSCSPHLQPIGTNSVREVNDEDEKEPAPPFAYWQQASTSLTSLYILPIIYFYFVHKRKIILLTGQLRF